MKNIIFTIIDKNYYNKCKLMLDSFFKHNAFYCNKAVVYSSDFLSFSDDRVEVRLLNKNFLKHNYSKAENFEALRSSFIINLIDECCSKGIKEIIYADADLYFYKELIFYPLSVEMQKLIEFTPHFIYRDSLHILKEELVGGFINGGFYRIAVSDASKEFFVKLNYLIEEFDKVKGITANINSGDFWQQTLLNYYNIIDIHSIVRINNNPSFNVGYWNFRERLKYDIAFYHFSGFIDDTVLSMYCKEEVPKELKQLYSEYDKNLLGI